MCAPRRLTAGRLTVHTDGPDLVSVRLDSREILSRVGVTLRDGRWEAFPLRCDHVEVADDGGLGVVASHLSHDENTKLVRWELTAKLTPTTLDVVAVGRSHAPCEIRRAGLVVLLPWAPVVGASFQASGAGDATSGVIPRDISPQRLVAGVYQPMISGFTHLHCHLPTSTVLELDLDGDVFEMEDQRNWTDASFKIYPTRLAESETRPMRPGDVVRHALHVTIAAPASAGHAPSHRRHVLEVGHATGTTLPRVGLEVDPLEMKRPTRDALARIAPSHVRVSWTANRDPPPIERLQAIVAITGACLELGVLLDNENHDQAAWLSRVSPTLVERVLLHPADGSTAARSFLHRAQGLLGVAPLSLVGGAHNHFSEINRHPCPSDVGDAVSFAISPQAHRVDEESMIETLEIQTQVVAAARRAHRSGEVVVSPVTLRRHEPGVQHPPDDRLLGPFGAAWTLGSYISLAKGGVSSITFHEPLHHYCDHQPQPAVLTVLRWSAALAGWHLVPVESSHERDVLAVGAMNGQRDLVVLISNLLPTPQSVEVRSGGSRMQQHLDPYEVHRFVARRDSTSSTLR